jgi:tetratricopeptide (TPR) repeat protein
VKVINPYKALASILLIGAIAIISCSTEKDAWLNRTYHNTTAKYNGFFNAGEIIKEAMTNYSDTRTENYNVIIPVYEYADEIGSKSLYAPMDTAAAKCETVIGRHSMPSMKKGQFRKTEWCSWIDDNWMVIGQSKFYKRDFEKALKRFIYIERQYSKEPIKYTSMLWQAKTYIELEEYEEAEDILKKLIEGEEELTQLLEEQKEEEKKQKVKSKSRSKSKQKSKSIKEDKSPPPFPKNFDREIAPIYADLFLRQKKYPKAVEKLEEAIEIETKRQFKTRLIFILAQVQQELGSSQASSLYEQVVKLNPKYEMAFQAKIKQALAYSGGNNKSIKAQLLKMVKDDKNAEYLDQIYFALADMTLREGDRPKGIEYLELSVLASSSNNDQKSKSFLRLGKLYYAEKNYIKAQRYYDSTMTVLPKEHEEFALIELQNTSLTELVDQLEIVNNRDSISQLCALSEKDLITKIEDLIQDKKDDDARIEEENNTMAPVPFGGNTPGGSGGKFWVWDNNLRGKGFNDFKTAWGNRKLEDNWRRLNKSSVSVGEENTDGEDGAVKDEYTIEFYMKTLPCGDDEKLLASNNEMMDALYEIGTIYRVKLDDPNAAKETFNNLVGRFLPKQKAVSGLYQLYLLETGEQKKKHKKTILNDFPDSEYAKLILNPNYKQAEQLAKDKDKAGYAATYQKYVRKQYDAVIINCNAIINTDSANAFLCNYYYLKAQAISGKNSGLDTLGKLEHALSDVVDHCEGHDVYAAAKGALDKIRKTNSIEEAKEGKGTYIFDPGLKHFFVMVIPNESGKTKDAKMKLSNFNSTSFSKSKLKTTSTFLDEETQLVLVKEFKNKKAAHDYYLAFKVNKKQVKSLNVAYPYFVITNKNYASLMIEKSLDEYLAFFKKNYAK